MSVSGVTKVILHSSLWLLLERDFIRKVLVKRYLFACWTQFLHFWGANLWNTYFWQSWWFYGFQTVGFQVLNSVAQGAAVVFLASALHLFQASCTEQPPLKLFQVSGCCSPNCLACSCIRPSCYGPLTSPCSSSCNFFTLLVLMTPFLSTALFIV